jgi:hypothetical protein
VNLRRLIDQQLLYNPVSDASWLGIVALDHARHGALSPAGVKALERLYAVAPLDPDLVQVRLRLVFENWRLLTPALRKAVLTDVRAKSQPGGEERELHTLDPKSIQDPAGRMALQIALASEVVRRSVQDQAPASAP